MEGWYVNRQVCLWYVFSAFLLFPTAVFGQAPHDHSHDVNQGNHVPVEGPSDPLEVQEEPGPIEGFARRVWGYVDPDNAEIISVHQLASLIDHIDKSLFNRGQVMVKNADVWGQNRLTQQRAEYEDQMKGQLGNFEVVLSSYQRRADSAALTSGTSIGASVGPTATGGTPAPIPSAVGLLGPSGLVANANSLIGTMTPVLMPNNLTSLALSNKNAATGIGLESTVLLDERSDFLNHLHQLRRNSAGDDRSDLPGYGLYLIRTPISILPGDQSIRGKGAIVTVRAKHNLTADLLANTFRNVVILDTVYQLMDAVTRGQYLLIGDQQEPGGEKQPSIVSVKPPNPCAQGADGQHARAFSALSAGSTRGGSSTGAAGEVVALYGAENLNKLVWAVKVDQESWFRHDPSVLSWLFTELASAYGYMREQAREGNPLFQPVAFENVGNLALQRDYTTLKLHRERWLQALAKQRNEEPAKGEPLGLRVRPLDILAFALMVQSVLVDRQLKQDMQVVCQRNGCVIVDPYQYCFFNLWPDEAAQHAFNKYVECKWPIHVFSLDPIIEQQNQLDLFSQRTELQLALATAIATGQVSFQNATSYARRLEQDLASINLNRTAVGFGAGEATYGWRFYPRYQSPPTQSNPRRIISTLVNNGPSADYALNKLRIEPGQRECYALMVVPHFAPQLKLTTVTNWFDLKTSHPHQELSTTDMVCLSRKIQTARNAKQRLCDSGRYRPVDLEVLGDRIEQLDAMLPMQSQDVILPFEADLTGSEIFTSFNAALGPRLLTWFGEPGQVGGSVFVLGTGFSVRDMKVIVGGVTVTDAGSASGGAPAPAFEIVSRNVLRIDIPATATIIRTPVVFKDPSFVCFNQGHGKADNGWCADCAGLNGAAKAAAVAANQADVGVKKSALAAAASNLAAYQYLQSIADAALKADPKNPTKQAASATAAQNVVAAQAAVGAAGAQVTVAEAAVISAAAPTAPTECECKQRSVIDVHVATSNGVSNHLLIETPTPTGPATPPPLPMTVSVTTTVKPAADGSTTTTTQYQTTAPGILPPGTLFPLNTPLPAGTTFVAPGAATINTTPPVTPVPAPVQTPKTPSAAIIPSRSTTNSTLNQVLLAQTALPVRPAIPIQGALKQQSVLTSRSLPQPRSAAVSTSSRRDSNLLPASAVSPNGDRRSDTQVKSSAKAPVARIKHTAPPAPPPSTRKSVLGRIFGGAQQDANR